MKKHNKILMSISSIISVLLYLSFIVFYFKIKFALKMTSQTADPDIVDESLSLSIKDPLFLSGFIIFILGLTFNLVAASYLITKGKTNQEKVFGYINLIIGGLGINLIYLLVIHFNKKNTKQKRKKVFKFSAILSLLSSPFLITIPLFGVAFYRGVDKPTHMQDIKYSTIAGSENLIEIFTDGFDPDLMKGKLVDDKNLEDFTIFPKWIVPGGETSFSLPSILNGIGSNSFNDENLSMVQRYDKLFDSLNSHLNTTGKNYESNTYLLNITDFYKNSPSYQTSYSGNPSDVAKMNPKLNFLNWAQAKEETAKYGISNLSPETQYMAWANTHSKINDKATNHGARVFMQDFITHSPRLTGKNRELVLSYGKGSKERSGWGLKNSLDKFMQSLKNLKNTQSGRSVYDNSMIIVFGDHSNHSNKINHYNSKNINAKKMNSMTMIKYPRYNNHSRDHVKISKPNPTGPYEVQDREIYAPFLNEIIMEWFKNKGSKPSTPFDFLNQNNNFDPGRNFMSIFRQEAQLTHFVNRQLEVYNQNNLRGWEGKGFELNKTYPGWAKKSKISQKDLLAPVKWKGKIYWSGEVV